VIPRQAIYELVTDYALSPDETVELLDLAGFNDEPAGVSLWLPRIIAVLAATLIGLGIILWFAANWGGLGRALKFGLLEGTIVISMFGAILRPAAKTSLLLLALLAQGCTLAFFGQTYQTGADPWQLFALWCLLALPLALAARSDVLWVPFALVTATGISLWAYAHGSIGWEMNDRNLLPCLVSWGMALSLNLWLSPFPTLRRLTNAGNWSFRTSFAWTTLLIVAAAIPALFSPEVQPHYMLALLVLAVGAGLLLAGRILDTFVISAIGLALDVLLICGMTQVLLPELRTENWIGVVFFLGVFAAGLFAATAALIRMLLRRVAEREEWV
jgi:uncharacterized membrane protein